MIGRSLGHYQVLSRLGEGGMGEVYRAHDHRLGRDVALKTLPDGFAHDPDRLARFEREAKTLASLNHPNIAAIYGIEDVPATVQAPAIHALVMELVPGRTLADVIASRAAHGGAGLAVTDAVNIAKQIALALEAAHDAGIIHRDLKPANVKVTDDDVVKVLDFGLARAAGVDAVFGGADHAAATVTSPAMTQAGVILGTAAYMAPEQARGKPIDKRADIWAFGVVLYEMLTGRRLFDGETVSDVVAQVLTRQVDMNALPAETPPRVRELVRRCLERDPKRRLRDIGEVRIALGDSSGPDPATVAASIVSQPATTTAAVAAPAAQSSRVPWMIAAVFFIASIAFGIKALNPTRPAGASSTTPMVLELGPPPDGDFLIGSNSGSIIMAPDASAVAFLVQTSTGRKLFVRSLINGETHAVPGVVDATYPFWSPDSKKLAYFGTAKLYTIALAGGLPEAIADINQGRGGTWTDHGVILFTPNGGGFVHRVSERGGEVADVTRLDDQRGENAHYWPVALPGGKKFLYFVRSTIPENNGIYLGSVDGSSKPVRVVTSMSSGLYSPPHNGVPGRLLWVRDANLLAQNMDAETGALSGDVVTLATDVRVEESQRGLFAAVANDGTLAWASAQAAEFQLATVDRDGRRVMTLPIPPAKILQPSISPDDRKMLFTRTSNGTADIWTYDFATKEVRQVTTDPDYDENGAWSPDGRDIFYQGRRDGKSATLIAAVDNSHAVEVVALQAGIGTSGYGHDGRSVFITRDREKDIALIRLAAPSVVIPVTPDPGSEAQAALSPDGRWLAFTNDRSGRFEILLASYEDDGTRVKLGEQRIAVSVGGGVDPHWRKDGKEIVYYAADGTIRSVSVTIAGNAVTLGRPTPLPLTTTDVGGFGSNWGVNSTHTQFVVVEAPRAAHQTFRVLLGK